MAMKAAAKDAGSEFWKQFKAKMDTILAHLKRDGHPLERWYYGHFHNSWHSEIDGVWYKMLDIMELLEVPRIKEEI